MSALKTAGIALVFLLAGCRAGGRGEPARGHRPVGDQATLLREAFNADAGKVRVVMLVAPS